MKKSFAFTALVIISLLAFRKPAIDIAAERQKIITSLQDWEKKAASGQPDYYWADSVLIMGPGQPMMKGKKQVSEMIAQMTKNGLTIVWDPVYDVRVSNDGAMAWLTGFNTATMKDANGATREMRNQCLQVWEKQPDGSWRAVAATMMPAP